MVLERN